jgi:enoyl-CoA hydratase/carnithine racemase
VDHLRGLETVQVEVNDRFATVTMCRSEAANSRNQRMREELASIWTTIGSDDQIAVVVLTGGPGRFFCAGMDLKEAGGAETLNERSARLRGVRDIDLLAALPQPTIAAINGYALGGGLEMALACDLRVAAEEASLGLPELDHGLVPGGGGTQRLPRLVGYAKAAELLYLGRLLTGAEAAAWGLVNRCVPRAQLHAAVAELAAAIAAKPPAALRAAKILLHASQEVAMADGMALELNTLLELMEARSVPPQEGHLVTTPEPGPDFAPLLAAENDEDHPQAEVARHDSVRVVAMDSARYCDSRNAGDIVVAASYCGTLPARLMAPHRPRAVLAHDVGIAADGSGISGLPYLEALGIPAAAVAAVTAELGNGIDMYHSGVVSRVNILAERCGVVAGMAVTEACRLLAENEPGNTAAGTKVRRMVAVSSPAGRSIVVTDSIVFALEEDHRNVLVTAGHTGKTGARFIEAVAPWGFICADGGPAKNGSGTAGLGPLDDLGFAGACYDISTAAMGDAFDAWERGRISATNRAAERRGVKVGQSVQEAAAALLAEVDAGGA